MWAILVFDETYDTGDGAALRKQYNIAPDAPVLTMLFGSRLSEIQTLAAPFADAVKRLKRAMPELAIVAPFVRYDCGGCIHGGG